jgi:hypothetical protein
MPVSTLRLKYNHELKANSFGVWADLKDRVRTNDSNYVSNLSQCGEINYFSSMCRVELTDLTAL